MLKVRYSLAGTCEGCTTLQETWRAQEEELSRLTAELSLLQQRGQQLQEALLSARRVQPKLDSLCMRAHSDFSKPVCGLEGGPVCVETTLAK